MSYTHLELAPLCSSPSEEEEGEDPGPDDGEGLEPRWWLGNLAGQLSYDTGQLLKWPAFKAGSSWKGIASAKPWGEKRKLEPGPGRKDEAAAMPPCGAGGWYCIFGPIWGANWRWEQREGEKGMAATKTTYSNLGRSDSPVAEKLSKDH